MLKFLQMIRFNANNIKHKIIYLIINDEISLQRIIQNN